MAQKRVRSLLWNSSAFATTAHVFSQHDPHSSEFTSFSCLHCCLRYLLYSTLSVQKRDRSACTGQCKLLLEAEETAIFGHQLNIGDVYGDDYSFDHRLNGLITDESNSCHVAVFALRDVQVCLHANFHPYVLSQSSKAYASYSSDMMKRSLLEQLRARSTFAAIQWRVDILDYFVRPFYTACRQ